MASVVLLASLIFGAILIVLPSFVECPFPNFLRRRNRRVDYEEIPEGTAPQSNLEPWQIEITQRENIPRCEGVMTGASGMWDYGPDERYYEHIVMDKNGKWLPWNKDEDYPRVETVDPRRWGGNVITMTIGPCTIPLKLDDGSGQVKLRIPGLFLNTALTADVKEDPSNARICVGAIFMSYQGLPQLKINLVAYAYKSFLVGYINTEIFEDMPATMKSKTDENGQETYYAFESVQLEKVVDPSETNYVSKDLLIELTLAQISQGLEMILTVGPCDRNNKYQLLSDAFGRMYAAILVK